MGRKHDPKMQKAGAKVEATEARKECKSAFLHFSNIPLENKHAYPNTLMS